MGQESSRAPKKVAQGVQKVPKGSQKVAKSHEKDNQKASTRHPNAISKCIGNSIANSISNAIANAIPTAIGNRSPRHGGGKAEGNWMSFSWLFATFWKPFGTFWTPWATFFGPRDDSWPISGPGCKKLRKSYKLVELWWLPGSPFWDRFGKVADFLGACFLLFFWVAILLTNCSSGVHLGSNLRCFLVYLGPLEIGLKLWRGYDFHTLEMLFAGMVSKLDRVEVYL